jgi:hypothetical protein
MHPACSWVTTGPVVRNMSTEEVLIFRADSVYYWYCLGRRSILETETGHEIE